MSSIIILIFQFQGYEMVSFETIVVPPPPPGEESDDEKPVWLFMGSFLDVNANFWFNFTYLQSS